MQRTDRDMLPQRCQYSSMSNVMTAPSVMNMEALSTPDDEQFYKLVNVFDDIHRFVALTDEVIQPSENDDPVSRQNKRAQEYNDW